MKIDGIIKVMRKEFDLPKLLFFIFVIFWAALAIKPLYRFDWFLENIVIFISAPLVIWSYYKFRLSNFSYILIFIFAILHVAAAHYTYGDTPWGDWLSQLLGLDRNYYDRIVHFLFGILMTPVVFNILKNYFPYRISVRNIFIFSIIVATGSLYEIAEFVVGILVEPEAGLAFLGFQGDIWDTQKDVLLQAVGSLLALTMLQKRN